MPTQTPTPISAARSNRGTAHVYDPLAARRLTRAELEASLEAYFYRQVRLALGGMVDKIAATRKGIPDRLVLLPGGRMYLCELKTEDGRVSAAQQLYHQRAAEVGTRVQVLVGRGGIDAWIKARGQELDGGPERTHPRRK